MIRCCEHLSKLNKSQKQQDEYVKEKEKYIEEMSNGTWILPGRSEDEDISIIMGFGLMFDIEVWKPNEDDDGSMTESIIDDSKDEIQSDDDQDNLVESP